MSSVIKVENLSKQYRLGEIGTGSLSHDLNRWWHQVRGKENPYLKIGESNDRTSKVESEYVWSLKDINFEIEQGDAVGIIGRNGAGKSTLLKILSRVTGPTTGSVKVKGRIASLLEVGTGFHPELSGRDNIFLNGAILGMRKAEIKKHFEEIVDFAGVERYIDTPVKRYSSGMYVRLAFAVAAHLESEILIVDEVLAVGDAEFQKKCLGKMNEVRTGEGRTVLFVSHNMSSIQKLCNEGFYLKNGILEKRGKIQDIISTYLSNNLLNNYSYSQENDKNIPICVTSINLMSQTSELIDVFEPLKFKICYNVNDALGIHSIAFKLKKNDETVFLSFINNKSDIILDKGKGFFEVVTTNFPENLLKAGKYSIDVMCGRLRTAPIQHLANVVSFELSLLSQNDYDSIYAENRDGMVAYDLNWEILK